MARTINEIYESMVTQKEAETNLSGLTSTSLTAVWALMYYICAVAIKVIEDLMDVLTASVEARREELPVGVLKWYASESLVYQFGDSLVFEDGRLDYATTDTSKYVVSLAAADLVSNVVVIKAAKVTSGVAAPLSTSELAGFTQYWIEKRFAGTSISIISVDPDLLKAEYTITYDPQILASDGALLTDAASFPVNDAIDAFLQTFQAENFAGDMQVMKLTDAIQTASGVTNAVATTIEGRTDAGSFVDILATTQQSYESLAGYMAIDPSFPLSGTLTYISG